MNPADFFLDVISGEVPCRAAKGFDATRDLPLIWAELQQQRRVREAESAAGGGRKSTATYVAPPTLVDATTVVGGLRGGADSTAGDDSDAGECIDCIPLYFMRSLGH